MGESMKRSWTIGMLVVGLSSVALAAESPDAPPEAQPCHPYHCHHSPPRCGKGWKDYPELITHEGEGTCDEAEAALRAEVEAAAAEKCEALHPCGTCPAPCSGCESKNPRGRLRDVKRRPERAKPPSASPNHAGHHHPVDEGQGCTIEAKAVYRCRCTDCKKPH